MHRLKPSQGALKLKDALGLHCLFEILELGYPKIPGQVWPHQRSDCEDNCADSSFHKSLPHLNDFEQKTWRLSASLLQGCTGACIFYDYNIHDSTSLVCTAEMKKQPALSLPFNESIHLSLKLLLCEICRQQGHISILKSEHQLSLTVICISRLQHKCGRCSLARIAGLGFCGHIYPVAK